YVTGYCRLAQGERVFRLDRIRDLEPTDEEFEPPAEIPEPQVSYTPSDDDVRARIALSPSARWVLDYYPVDVVEDGPDPVVLDFSASDPLVAARLLLRLGTRARLLGGPEVAEALQALGQRVLARYRCTALGGSLRVGSSAESEVGIRKSDVGVDKPADQHAPPGSDAASPGLDESTVVLSSEDGAGSDEPADRHAPTRIR